MRKGHTIFKVIEREPIPLEGVHDSAPNLKKIKIDIIHFSGAETLLAHAPYLYVLR